MKTKARKKYTQVCVWTGFRRVNHSCSATVRHILQTTISPPFHCHLTGDSQDVAMLRKGRPRTRKACVNGRGALLVTNKMPSSCKSLGARECTAQMQKVIFLEPCTLPGPAARVERSTKYSLPACIERLPLNGRGCLLNSLCT